VSSVITDRVLGHQAIMIASPIFNKQKELSGLLLASLRFDYISSSLNAFKPQYHFEVTDKYVVAFLTDDNNETSDAHYNMLTTPLQ
ncbi:histidine kinase, partial [Bacillus cereus group sp. Bce007]